MAGSAYVGGLIGYLNSTGTVTIARSAVMGNLQVTGGSSGGFIGYAGGSVSVTDSYNLGNVTTGATLPQVGGMFGAFFGTGTNLYTTAQLSGGPYSATNRGFKGSGAGACTNCFCTDTTIGICNGATLVNSTQINQQATFTGWDFVSTWSINEGVSSPALR